MKKWRITVFYENKSADFYFDDLGEAIQAGLGCRGNLIIQTVFLLEKNDNVDLYDIVTQLV